MSSVREILIKEIKQNINEDMNIPELADALIFAGLIKTDVIQFKDGNLYCLDCGEKVSNEANYEMRKEGWISHSHICKTGVER